MKFDPDPEKKDDPDPEEKNDPDLDLWGANQNWKQIQFPSLK